MSRNFFIILLIGVALLAGTGTWAWKRYGPSGSEVYVMNPQELPLVKNVKASTSACDLSIRHYKQIGKEVQFELYASSGGLAPYTVEITQKGKSYRFENAPHRGGTWFSLTNLQLATGPATIRITSENDSQCETSGVFDFDEKKAKEILPVARWIRQGSEDIMLDVRPLEVNGKLYLKDFANYQDGRTKVYLIDDIIVEDLEKGLEVRPNYLYSVIACWIDAPYSEWWNHLRNRSIRQQNIWVRGSNPASDPKNSLVSIPIPDWFTLSRRFNVEFDTRFPEFDPIPGKLVMQYRLNTDVPATNYFKRGITHLPKWETGIAPHKTHWTEPPGFFGDKDEDWFSSLSKKEVESYADKVYPSGVYAFDFEFWNRNYKPAVKERLIWFAERIKRNHPETLIFDYWGSAAYHNDNFWYGTKITPSHFKADYQNPKATHSNFDPLPNGKSLADYYSITPVDVYPKPFFSGDPDGITPNNYLLLAAVHAARVNRLFPSQKNNKTIWFAWNRYMPLYKDPSVPWHVSTTAPRGEIIFDQLVTMPASQALAMSLFSLVESDGYYLWHDNQAQGSGVNNYSLDPQDPTGYQWYPADGKARVSTLKRGPNAKDSPRYWDYPTEFFALGNWMATQVGDILAGGKKIDLDYKTGSTWHKATVDQAVVSADQKEPFVTAVTKSGKIAVLAIDSFQKPNAVRHMRIKLPNGREEAITLYGNWPSLYRGTI